MMFILIIYIIISFLLLLQLLFTSKYNKNKMMSIEAGFFSLGKSTQNSFSMQFVLLMLIFITFDLEILFISSILMKINILMMLFFSFFMLLTLLMEWLLNTLKWLIYEI